MPSLSLATSRSETVELPAAPRILGIRFSAIGDTLLTFPALRTLRTTYPDAHLAFLTDTRCAGLFDGLEVLDELLTLDRVGLKKLRTHAVVQLLNGVLRPALLGSWDVVVDFQSFTETAVLAAISRAPVRVGRQYKTGASRLYRPWIGVPHPPTYMTAAHIDTLVRAGLAATPSIGQVLSSASFYRIPAKARQRWHSRSAALRLSPVQQVPRIAVFVGAAKPHKLWPARRFTQLLLRLAAETPHSFLIFAGPGEQQVARQVVDEATSQGLADRIVEGGCGELATLAAAFDECSATVSNDTGPLHLSVAVGTPTLGIFCTANPHFIPPLPHRHVIATEGRIDTVTVDQVAAAVHALLG